jgi:hypothetical protein
MQPDRLKTIEEIFHAALQLRDERRSAYLDTACVDDPELRSEVESLLETNHSPQFMEKPAGGMSIASLIDERPSLEGRFLNHYNIGPLLGRGGMGEVYRARDTRLGRDVAIKVLHNFRFLERERLDSLYREARLLASLNHPNIASVYGIEEADGVCGLVLELVEGVTLAERVSRGPVPVSEAIDIAIQIAAGLQAAHAKGIIHRDLKPSNVKITPEATVKIVDFGIAKLLHTLNPEQTMLGTTNNGVVVGTVAYMSPEQARGKSVDVRTDIWAFGCMLYEMLAGKPAFEGTTPTDIIVKIATEEPDWNRVQKISADGFVEVERLIRKCIQKNVDFRYQSVREITADLAIIQRMLQDPEQYQPLPRRTAVDDDFVLPDRYARAGFVAAQFGYLALYGAAMYHIDAIATILTNDFLVPAPRGFIGTMILAMFGIAVRIYMISAVGWRHPAAGRKYQQLFPLLLVLDSIWAASPLLLWRRIGLGLAFTGVALLAYVPFAQRTLMRTIYPRQAGN